MSDILDAPEPRRAVRTTFSKLSLGTSLLTIVLIISLAKPMLSPDIRASEIGLTPSIPLLMAFHASWIGGLVFTLLSFTRKERSSVMKWVGAVLNILLGIIIVGSVFYALQLDMIRR